MAPSITFPVNTVFKSCALFALACSLLFADPLPAAQADSSKSVDLTIQLPNGNPKHFTLPYRSGMTVFDAMTEAQGQPGGIHFEYQGARRDPSTLLLVSIDGVANQGGGADKRNWTYRVNSLLGDRSFGVCKIAPSAHILWQFDIFHPNEPMKPGACQ